MKSIVIFVFFCVGYSFISYSQNDKAFLDYIITHKRDTIYGNLKIVDGFRLFSRDVNVKDTIGKRQGFLYKDFRKYSKDRISYETIFDDRIQKPFKRFFAPIVIEGEIKLMAVENERNVEYEKNYMKNNKRNTRFTYYPVMDYILKFPGDEEAGFYISKRRFKAKLLSKLTEHPEVVKWIKERKFVYSQIPKLMYLYNGGEFNNGNKYLDDIVINKWGDTIIGQINLSRRLKIYPKDENKVIRYSYSQVDYFRQFSANYECMRLKGKRSKKPFWMAAHGAVDVLVEGVNQCFSYDVSGDINGVIHDSGIYYLRKEGSLHGPITKGNVKKYIRELMGDWPFLKEIDSNRGGLINDLIPLVKYYNSWHRTYY
ncbi:MAG: hypothetical protein ACEPOV_10960 [Hyphomicrobiales bacterium]